MEADRGKRVRRTTSSVTKRLLFLGALAACAVTGLASAQTNGQATLGTVYNVYPTNWGMVYFQQNGTRTNRPACATQDRWVINDTTPTGQAMVSVLLTAYAAGKPIFILGTGDCRDWPDTESIVYFQVP